MEAVFNNVGILSMATLIGLRRPSATLFSSLSRLGQPSLLVSKACLSSGTIAEQNPVIIRRSGNYKPSMWDFEYIQSIHNDYMVFCGGRAHDFAEKLSFSRDRLVENLFWAVGIEFEPQHSYFRRMLTKVIAFVGIIDDIYDVYGTLDELEVFTDAIERWEIKAIEQLLDYMKWADLCKSFIREARWYYSGYVPTLKEYMDNAWISIAVPMVLVHAFFLVTNSVPKEALESLSKYPDLIRCFATIFRLADDLATSSDELKRGDVPKSIQCYMNEKDASEEEAREHIHFCIKETWERMNTAQRENSLFSKTFVEITKNIARTAHCMYLHGHGHGIQNGEVKNSISKILFEPITIPSP
ncbi:(R)-linalool synthase TPS5, chloroplastic-like [Nicotiana tabacum]|uniref:(R)-linalool synthase TPS5, chloroplastic-like n=1 Tax=Nicotiana tabacum TaxID=4097 RepID=A0AC58TDK1_TOBAC